MLNILKKFLSVILSAALILALSGCNNSKSSNLTSDSALVEAGSTASADAENVVPNNNDAVLLSRTASDDELEPFSTYSFKFSCFSDNYIITAAADENNSSINLSIEDNKFNYSEFTITPPDKYMINIPYAQEAASQICTVLNNNSDDQSTSQILQFDFYLSDFSDETMPYVVSKFYSIKDDVFSEISIIDNTKGAFTELEYVDDTPLYNTDKNTLMASPTAYEDESGYLHADIYIYNFVPEKMLLVKNTLDLESADPIYYGYSCLAVADSISEYFMYSSLNVSDYNNYTEITSNNSDNSEYYFKVDDERFKDTESLKNFLRQYFTQKIADNIFLNSPTKYRDINGELYTAYGDYYAAPYFGRLIIKDYIDNVDTLTFRILQEKFDNYGNITGVIDGGDFTVSAPDDNGRFIISEYPYPYN